METNLPENVEWSFIKKFLFLFLFIFFTLYIFLNPNNIVPYSSKLYHFYTEPCNRFIAWLTIDILHVAAHGTPHIIGTNDTTFGYLTLLFITSVALIGSVIWLAIGRKTGNYNKLYYALITTIRYFLAIMWVTYGSLKITRLQFPLLGPDMLLQTYGNSTPHTLSWAFMGYSSGYNYFIGITECAIGLLLFFGRTSLFGNLIAIGALANVMAFNYFFDVNVKLLVTVLMSMTLFLLSKDLVRLINFLLFNKVTPPVDFPSYRFKGAWKNKLLLGFKYVFILFLVVADLYSGFTKVKQRANLAKKTPLYGIYNVDSFVLNKDTIRPVSDTLRWKKLVVSSPQKASVIFMNDSIKHYVFIPDTIKKIITMYTEMDTINKFTFSYNHPKADRLIMHGKWQNDSLEIKFQQYDLKKFPLLNHPFRWIIGPDAKAKK